MGLELILLPFLASVAVTIGLRRLDKSNTKLSQLKRYATKLTEEIHNSALVKIQSVKDAGIDLDILVKQSRKVAEEIQNLSAESRELFEKLKSNKEYLSTIAGELDQVAYLGQEVKKETSMMESGLQQIHSHKRELENLSLIMDRIQDESQEMVHEFESKLNQRSDEILQSVAHKMVELEGLLESKSESLDESIQHIAKQAKEKLVSHAEVMVQESTGKVDQVKREIDALFDSMRLAQNELDLKLTKFEDTSSLLADKVDKFDEKIEDKYLRISQKLDDRVALLEKKIQERFDSIFDQVSHTKDSFMKGLSNETQTIKREIEDLSLETLSKRDEIINETRRQADQINQTITSFQEKYLEAENKLLRQADTRKQELIREIETFSEEFHRISEELKEEASHLKKSALQELKTFERDLEEARNAQENQTKTSLLSLKHELEESIKNSFAKSEAEISQEIEGLEKRISSLGQNVEEHTKEVDEYVEELKGALRETASEILESVEEKAEKAEEIVTEKIHIANANLEQFVQKWEESLSHLRADQLDSIEELQNRLKDIHIEGKDLLASFQDASNEGKTQLNRHADSLVQKISDTTSIAEKELSHILQSLEETGNAFFHSQEEKMDRLNETIDSKISHQLTKLLDKGNIQLGQLEEKITQHLNGVRKNLEESIKRSKEESKRQIETYQKDYEKSFREIAKDSRDFLKDTHEQFQILKSEIADGLSEFKETKEETLSEIRYNLDEITETISTLKSDLEEVKEHTDLFVSANQIAEKSEKAVSEIKEALSQMEEKKPDFEIVAQSIETFHELQEKIREEWERIQISQNQTEDIDKQVEILSSQVEFVKGKMDEFQGILPEVSSLENRLLNISRDQEKIESFLSSLQESEDSVLLLVDNIENQKQNTREVQARLDILDREIGVVEARERELAESIRLAENKTSFLSEKASQMESVERKFEKIEELLGDLSDRHKQILTLQKRLEELRETSVETRDDLESLLGEADETFEKLSQFLDIVQSTMAPTPNQEKTARKTGHNPFIERKKATILSLYDNYQWTAEAISEKLNIEKSLVDTILGARKK
ncbi:hypothetical protein LPTSP4_23490 [Leptospira ryugenii]|uniref:Chromosome segregation protein SMC n=1 Tax=Leptospira ryugenii TaxID=1917863 RepID=A0A2P2E1R0_9LEPT|nr:hypothetical protein [Leptospira ryugenii]GBF50822.1 hypothetical protein LPTSP4_23490 [Leptospira ryugenii]